jgi:hypothetical protein
VSDDALAVGSESAATIPAASALPLTEALLTEPVSDDVGAVVKMKTMIPAASALPLTEARARLHKFIISSYIVVRVSSLRFDE